MLISDSWLGLPLVVITSCDSPERASTSSYTHKCWWTYFILSLAITTTHTDKMREIAPYSGRCSHCASTTFTPAIRRTFSHPIRKEILWFPKETNTSMVGIIAREDTHYLKMKKKTKTIKPNQQNKLTLMRLNIQVVINMIQGYPKTLYYSSACAP